MKTKRLAAALLRISIALAIAIPGSPQDEDPPDEASRSVDNHTGQAVPVFGVDIDQYGNLRRCRQVSNLLTVARCPEVQLSFNHDVAHRHHMRRPALSYGRYPAHPLAFQ